MLGMLALTAGTVCRVVGPDAKLEIVEDGTGTRVESVMCVARRIEERDGLLVLLAPDGEHEAVTDDWPSSSNCSSGLPESGVTSARPRALAAGCEPPSR